jgi:hypothetical protein
MREISPVDPRLAIRPALPYPALVFAALGAHFLSLLRYLGQLGGLVAGIVESLLHGKPRWRITLRQVAEIGTMKVTEQIDALRSMGVHPTDYLVTPRLIAMLVAMPLLIAESAAFGIIASLLVGTTGPNGVNAAY